MAPKARLCRHQLGEATINHRRLMLNATLPFVLLLTFFIAKTEARTELDRDSWSSISANFLAYERPSSPPSVRLASFTPCPVFFDASPVGRWRSKTQIPIPNRPEIQRYIGSFTRQERRTFMEALERSWPFVPVMAEVLESHGVPGELVYIALVESRFKGRVVSRGACGYWQLMPATARSLGLRIDRWVDERKDPIKSTEAAAKYLRLLYERFDSWPLALAAYNAGDSPVQNAMRKCKTSDFWELANRRALPGRTREYVSKVLAAIHIVRDLENHGFDSPDRFVLYDFEPITVQAPLTLDQVAKWIGISLGDLRDLNPSLSYDHVPPDTDKAGFDLHLPSGSRDRFDMAYEDFLRK